MKKVRAIGFAMLLTTVVAAGVVLVGTMIGQLPFVVMEILEIMHDTFGVFWGIVVFLALVGLLLMSIANISVDVSGVRVKDETEE